ncbi:phosphopantetheine-binding protein [Streptomyces bambusae]|uniref:phosphopantetheine-binding protein n=1 Tax=Streptomyces bambusae TaxID=1550616 RepID=UPI001CFECAE5|nr:phosphopantetheine-binding protein [Streptomyces bambusae]MCB5164641.1 phosphopantetheine-binding protein [Streptomyces bambusae]
MAAVTLESATAAVITVLHEITGVEVGTEEVADLNLQNDLDVDSLNVVEVVVALEEQFAIRIPDEETQNLETVGDVARLVVDLSRDAGAPAGTG